MLRKANETKRQIIESLNKRLKSFLPPRGRCFVSKINDITIETFKHNHGLIDAHTYRINNFAYSTDIKNFYENDIDKLKNLDVWIVGLLRYDDHPSHAGFNKILEYIDYLKPKKTVFTHMTALLDYKELSRNCPINVTPGYDGLIINI